jgi:dihydroorotate dehydrogenase electron transfer subunit
MTPVIEITTVIDKIEFNPSLYQFKLKAPIIAGISKPGQFVEIDPGDRFFLRRPFSIQDAKRDIIEILVKVVGAGSDSLVKKESAWNLIGPLGNSFSDKNGHKVLIAGGVGFAPLKFLYQDFKRRGLDSDFIFGAPSFKDIPISGDDKLLKDIDTATEDGSHGFKGTALDLLKKRLEKKNIQPYIYACGPLPMLSALRDLMAERGWEGEFALENRMGCGMGVCQGCAIPVKDGYKLVCKDGPVFDYRQIAESYWK